MKNLKYTMLLGILFSLLSFVSCLEEELKEEPKEVPTEEPKEVPAEEPKEVPKEQKKTDRIDLKFQVFNAQSNCWPKKPLKSTIQKPADMDWQTLMKRLFKKSREWQKLLTSWKQNLFPSCLDSSNGRKQTSMTFTIEQETDPASPDKPTPVAWTMFPDSFECNTFPYTNCKDLLGNLEEGYSKECGNLPYGALPQRKTDLHTFRSVSQWQKVEKNHGCFFPNPGRIRNTPKKVEKMQEFVLSTDFQKERIIFIRTNYFDATYKCVSTYDSAFSIYHLNGMDYFAYTLGDTGDSRFGRCSDNDGLDTTVYRPIYYMLRVESTRKIRILHLKQ